MGEGGRVGGGVRGLGAESGVWAEESWSWVRSQGSGGGAWAQGGGVKDLPASSRVRTRCGSSASVA